MQPTRTLVLAAALGVLTIGGVAGCSGIYNRLEDGVVHDQPVAGVVLAGGGGDITVTIDSKIKGVDVRRKVNYLHQAPSIDDTISFSGDQVTLKTDCGAQCRASYDVHMPAAGVKVTGENGSGDIRLQDVSDVDIELGSGNVNIDGASGSVKVKNGSGDIDLADIAGAVTITSGSGNLNGLDLRGATNTIDLSSGDVTLDVPGTGDVKAVTSSGNIHLQVPNNTCRITVHTSSGDQDIESAPDPASPRLIDLRTGSGDITVKPSL